MCLFCSISFETSLVALGRLICTLANGWNLFLIVSRLEERESEMKKEYNALHQRHTEVGYHLIISEQTNS